jgi:hypothetical protein
MLELDGGKATVPEAEYIVGVPACYYQLSFFLLCLWASDVPLPIMNFGEAQGGRAPDVVF